MVQNTLQRTLKHTHNHKYTIFSAMDNDVFINAKNLLIVT